MARSAAAMQSELRITLPLLAILVIAALLNGFYLSLAGRNARPEHLAAPLLFLAFVLWRVVRRQPVIRVDAFSALAVAWVVINGVSSWLYAPQPSESFVHVVRMSFLVAIFLTVANLPFSSGTDWMKAFRLWVGLGLLELAYGVVIWFLAHYADLWLPGTYLEGQLSGISTKGTLHERNLFGILAGTLLLVTSYSLLAQRARDRVVVASSGLLVAACALATVAVVVSLTRSAWIAVVAVGPIAYVLFDRRRLARTDRPLVNVCLALPALLGASIAVFQLLPARGSAAAADTVTTSAGVAPAGPIDPEDRGTPAPLGTSVESRLQSFGKLEGDATTNVRIQDARWALNDWLSSPVLGHGTGSFGQIHGRRAGSDAWISNLILHTLVDTGLVGLVIQVSLIALVARRAWRTSLVTRELAMGVALRAMTLGLLVMLVAYQFTDGTWMAVFWIHLALLVNGVYQVHGEQLPSRSAQTSA